MVTTAQKDIIDLYMESNIEAIVADYPDRPDLARLVIRLGQTGKELLENDFVRTLGVRPHEKPGAFEGMQNISKFYRGDHGLRSALLQAGEGHEVPKLDTLCWNLSIGKQLAQYYRQIIPNRESVRMMGMLVVAFSMETTGAGVGIEEFSSEKARRGISSSGFLPRDESCGEIGHAIDCSYLDLTGLDLRDAGALGSICGKTGSFAYANVSNSNLSGLRFVKGIRFDHMVARGTDFSNSGFCMEGMENTIGAEGTDFEGAIFDGVRPQVIRRFLETGAINMHKIRCITPGDREALRIVREYLEEQGNAVMQQLENIRISEQKAEEKEAEDTRWQRRVGRRYGNISPGDFSEFLEYKYGSEMAKSFECPLSLAVMTDPVIAHGDTFDRSSIERVIREYHHHPNTRAPLTLEELMPNRSMRVLIENAKEEYRHEFPEKYQAEFGQEREKSSASRK